MEFNIIYLTFEILKDLWQSNFFNMLEMNVKDGKHTYNPPELYFSFIVLF